MLAAVARGNPRRALVLTGVVLAAGACAGPLPAIARPPTRALDLALPAGALHVTDTGEGEEALVFVHGWLCDGRVFRAQVPALSDVARLVVVDLPGHGGSAAPVGPLTMAGLADAVALALAELGVARAVVVGHSNGSPVALQLARRHPRLVRGLVVIEGALVLMVGDAAARERLLAPFKGEGAAQRALDAARASLSPGRSAAELEDLVAMAAAISTQVMESSLDAAWDPSAWSEERLPVPVLAIMAASPYWSPEYWDRVAAFVPDLEQVTWPGTHLLMLDRPEDVNRAIATFVRRRGLLD